MMPTVMIRSYNGVGIVDLYGIVTTMDLDWLKNELTKAAHEYRGKVALNLLHCRSFSMVGGRQLADFVRTAGEGGHQFRLFSASDVEKLGLDAYDELWPIIYLDETAALVSFN